GLAVTFGGVAATGVTDVSATTITATSPAGSGTVDVLVTNSVGTSSATPSDQFTYSATPTVTSLNPTSGPQSGGTSVTIRGTNFTGVNTTTGVKFGGVNATSIVVLNSSTITANSPATLNTGTVDVTVTTPSGTSATSASDHFTYNAVTPTVTAV